MSFWTQEEDSDNDDGHGGGGGEGGGLTKCTNCGCSEYYQEEDSGLYFCSECFTQSQTMQLTTQLEYEEMQLLGAGRKHGPGGMRTDGDASRGYKQNMSRKRGQLLLDPVTCDNSKRLPTLKECLFLLHSVLTNASLCAAHLADLPNKQALVQISKDIFIQYLQAWREAALWAHPYYPEMRLSFRDYFFALTTQTALRHHIAYEIHVNKIRQKDQNTTELEQHDDTSLSKFKQNNPKQQNNSDDNDDHASSSDNDDHASSSDNDDNESSSDNDDHESSSDNDDDSASEEEEEEEEEEDDDDDLLDMNEEQYDSVATTVNNNNDNSTRIYCETLRKFVMHEVPAWMRGDRGDVNENVKRHLAALCCKPTIYFICGTIVGLALRKVRSGHDFLHLIAWARQGLYPYFLHPLYPSKKDISNPAIYHFFRPESLPKMRILIKYADFLCVAIGWGAGDNTCEPQKLPETKKSTTSEPTTTRKQVTTTQQLQLNVPLFLARIVSALNIPQHTYDIALSLMNIPPNLPDDIQKIIKTKPEKYWLPAPISCFKNKNDKNFISPIHIMAYLAVAIQMTPGWQDWNIHLKQSIIYSSNLTNDTTFTDKKQESLHKREYELCNDDEGDDYSSVISSSSSSSSSLIDSSHLQKKRKKRKTGNPLKNQRFIPWNDAQLNMIGNGRMLEEYLDYVHNHLPNFEHYFKPKREHHVEFLKSFKQLDEDYFSLRQKKQSSEKQYSSNNSLSNINKKGPLVRPNTVLAGAANPNMPKATLTAKGDIIQKDEDQFFWHLFHRNKRAIWMDANGYKDYVVYSEDALNQIRQKVIGGTRKWSSIYHWKNQPVHPHFGFLIEFFAQIIEVDTEEISEIVQFLNTRISLYYNSSYKQRKEQK